MALAKKPFVVIDSEILSSSIWSEPAHVRLVWITLLILCDTEGYVGAAVPGIAHAAGVTLSDAEDAIERLQRPDPYSRTQTSEGRRLVRDERGWRVLNFIEHVDRLSAERRKSRERVRRFRERRKRQDETDVTLLSAQRAENREQGPVNSEKNGSTAYSKPSSTPSPEKPVVRRTSTEPI